MGKGPLLLARKGLTLAPGLIGSTATSPSGTTLGLEVDPQTRPHVEEMVTGTAWGRGPRQRGWGVLVSS